MKKSINKKIKTQSASLLLLFYFYFYFYNFISFTFIAVESGWSLGKISTSSFVIRNKNLIPNPTKNV